MSTLAARYGSPPRTPERPRGFTLGEFAAGAVRAWVWFQPGAVIAATVVDVMGGGGIIGVVEFGAASVLFGMLIGIPAVILGAPFAYLLGRALQRQRRDVVHLAALAAYGALVGVVTLLETLGPAQLSEPSTVAYVLAAAAALPAGWWRTSRAALRADRRRQQSDRAAEAAIETETTP
ncbi:MAG TPA: hypothetical protein VGC45_09945 [Gryllotalpicola sp.]